MLDPINLIIGGLFFAFVLLDTLFPARNFPDAKLWRMRGVIAAIAYIALATYAPFLWASWLRGPLLFDASGLPIGLQILLGFAAIQLVSYWWHRAMHKSDILWRVFHQMHHSVERMDGWGALYHHPLDVVGFAFMGSFALTMIVGITAESAAIVAIIGMAAVYFTHCNIRTPQWIGWFVERPEGHGCHHERGRHAGNYAELVIWDQIFGTWKNPKSWDAPAGFHDGASLRIWDMLLFRDVDKQDNAASPDKPAGSGANGSASLIGLITAGFLIGGLAQLFFPMGA